jgi:uncharacterized membrane-anchored protein
MTATKIVVDCTTGEAREVPLAPEEQADKAAAEVEALAAAATARTGAANRITLEDKATQALATNAKFLALTTPTNAQTLAQVKALTRENTAIIRLLLNRLDTDEGT